MNWDAFGGVSGTVIQYTGYSLSKLYVCRKREQDGNFQILPSLNDHLQYPERREER